MQSQNITGAKASEEAHHTVVIGGGQAGLAAGYYLARQKQDFVILDENARTGDSWRKRWDSLRLFSPAQLDGLPGFPFPQPEFYFPTKDEAADYLESYAERFQLPVRHGVKVDRLGTSAGKYEIVAGASTFHAENVIVASGPYQFPRVPDLAGELDKSILQLHSSQYCNPGQIEARDVLVVGAGNSGVEIAIELASTGKQVWLAGRDVGMLAITQGIGRVFGGRPAWWLTGHVLTLGTPIGRRVRVKFLGQGHPLGRVRPDEIAQAGVKRTGRVIGMEHGQPKMEDGRSVSAECVIWATGFHPQFDWIDIPIFGEDGYPRHRRGVVDEARGLYFVGLPFQWALSSSLLGGVGADAEYVVRQIAHAKKNEVKVTSNQ